MEFKINAPNIYDLNATYFEDCKKLGVEQTPENWQKFLKKSGLAHISLSRLQIVDQEKWFLAKIKYGL
jgi:hypothetical protein